MAFSVSGISVGRGIAIGRAWVLAPASLDVPRRSIEAGEAHAEVERLYAAVRAVDEEFEKMRHDLGNEVVAELRAFLDLQAIVLHDPMLIETTRDRILAEQCNAEWALVQQYEQVAEQFDAIEDAYLRERRADVRQIVERILKAMRHPDGGARINLPQPTAAESGSAAELPWILVAHDIAPADMLLLKQHSFAGFATDTGSPTSHTAILARSLGLPAVVGLQTLYGLIQQGEPIIIDAEAGVVLGSIDAPIRSIYEVRQAEQAVARSRLTRLKNVAAQTLDGQAVSLFANLDLPSDAAHAMEAGCQGVGLFRSEFLYMNRDDPPSEQEQYEAYRSVVMALKGRPVTIRTLDSGADKDVPSVSAHRDPPSNPALALRAIRLCLAEPELFMTQLRAILRASAHGPIKCLIPLISGPQEMVSARKMIAAAMDQLKSRQQPFDDSIPIGAMIEVPAAALAIDGLLPELDFASLGTNDLIQYTLAIDRADGDVAHLYNPLHPAVLRLIADVIKACNRRGTPVSVCGEMAGDPVLTRLLLGFGLREFSMHPAQVLVIKQEILRSRASDCSKQSSKILRQGDPMKLAAALARWNQDRDHISG
ncbi:MAG: phosphoenolpyruvate--protein phosphotransferase [Betaproteobacteria bacterium]|nr:phosphoenolpyruvate--protein phosphotransferase [Betaproteobacteria bacterium]